MNSIDKSRSSMAAVSAARDSNDRYISIPSLRCLLDRTNAVFRISIRDSKQNEIGSGTGFLLAPGLAMTNYHNLPNRESALRSKAQFLYENGGTPIEIDFDPASFFYPSPAPNQNNPKDISIPLKEGSLDFIVIALELDPRLAKVQKSRFSLQDLTIPEEKEIVKIIQHPCRNSTSFQCISEGIIIHSDDNFLVHYNAPADHGSSGSPVLDSKNHLVGLHRSECPKKDSPRHKSHQLCSTAISINKIVGHLKSYNMNGECVVPNNISPLEDKSVWKEIDRWMARTKILFSFIPSPPSSSKIF